MWTPNIKLLKVFRLGQSFANRQLQDVGLSSGLFYFIVELAQHDSLSMSELSAAAGVDNAYATRSVEKLVKLGYVIKAQDEIDRRAFRVSLTDAGQAAARRVDATLKDWVAIITAGVSPEEIATVNRVFEQFYRNIRSHQE